MKIKSVKTYESSPNKPFTKKRAEEYNKKTYLN
jgi:hypothetical protein